MQNKNFLILTDFLIPSDLWKIEDLVYYLEWFKILLSNLPIHLMDICKFLIC